MNLSRRTSAALALGGLSLMATLAGCAGSPSDAATPGGASESAGPYPDGNYTATGSYQSPDGPESIEVEVSLMDDVVTAVTVTGDATTGSAVRYQSAFAEGISAEIVGVDIDDLQVDKVAGSSLTSDGFTAAIEQIKGDALA